MEKNSCATESGNAHLFAALNDSLFDDADLCLFEELNTDYVRNSVVPFASLFEELNTEQDQGSCERCTA